MIFGAAGKIAGTCGDFPAAAVDCAYPVGNGKKGLGQLPDRGVEIMTQGLELWGEGVIQLEGQIT